MKITRRRAMLLSAAGATSAIGATLGLNDDGEDGLISGGTMALSQAYKIAEDERALYIGPDSAKGNISPNDGDVYMAADTDVDYHGDAGSWVLDGVGSSQQAVPGVHTDDVDITREFDPTLTDSIYWEWLGESGAPFRHVTSGSGSSGHNIAGYEEISTGSTSGSTAWFRKNTDQGTMLVEPASWDKDRTFLTVVDVLNGDGQRIDYIQTGDSVSNDSQGIGFKLVEVGGTPTLQGFAQTGGTETTTDLLANPGTGTRVLRVEYISGNRAEFYVDKTKQGQITTGLPTGTSGAKFFSQHYVENTGSVNRGLEVGQIRMLQHA